MLTRAMLHGLLLPGLTSYRGFSAALDAPGLPRAIRIPIFPPGTTRVRVRAQVIHIRAPTLFGRFSFVHRDECRVCWGARGIYAGRPGWSVDDSDGRRTALLASIRGRGGNSSHAEGQQGVEVAGTAAPEASHLHRTAAAARAAGALDKHTDTSVYPQVPVAALSADTPEDDKHKCNCSKRSNSGMANSNNRCSDNTSTSSGSMNHSSNNSGSKPLLGPLNIVPTAEEGDILRGLKVGTLTWTGEGLLRLLVQRLGLQVTARFPRLLPREIISARLEELQPRKGKFKVAFLGTDIMVRDVYRHVREVLLPLLDSRRLRILDHRCGAGTLSGLTLRLAEDCTGGDGSVLLRLKGHLECSVRPRLLQLAETLSERCPALKAVTFYDIGRPHSPDEVLFGSDALLVSVFGQRFRITGGTRETIVGRRDSLQQIWPAVKEAAGAATGLLWGALGSGGFFEIGLSFSFRKVVVFAAGVRDAEETRKNMSLNELYWETTVEGALHLPDVLLLSPSRGGLTKDVRRWVAAAAVPRVIYIAHEQPAFLRDAKALVAAGYELAYFKAFDVSPHTVEVLSVSAFSKRHVDLPPAGGSQKKPLITWALPNQESVLNSTQDS